MFDEVIKSEDGKTYDVFSRMKQTFTLAQVQAIIERLGANISQLQARKNQFEELKARMDAKDA